jgi:hypothetical protein
MWKKIDCDAIAEKLDIGNIISADPEDPQERYMIKLISDGYVRAVHTDGKISLKGFPTKVLISGNWWVKEQ